MYVQRLSLPLSSMCRMKVARLVVAVVVVVDVVFRSSRGRNAREGRKWASGVVMGIMYWRGYVMMQDESGRNVGAVVVGREIFRGCLGGWRWQPKQCKRRWSVVVALSTKVWGATTADSVRGGSHSSRSEPLTPHWPAYQPYSNV